MPESAPADFATTLHYTESLMRRVVFAFWRRTVGVLFPLVLLAMAALIAIGASLYGMNWYLVVLAAVVILGTLLVIAIFVTHYRHTLGRFRRLKSPSATLSVNRELFTVTSDLGSSTLKWHAVTELWRFPEFWLVMLSKAQFVTLPLSGIPAEMQQFIRERAQLAGGKVQ